MPLRVYLQGLTSMDGGELADSIMNFTEEQPSNPKAFRYAKIWLPAAPLSCKGCTACCQ